ncbi:MAG: hypothetical protein RL654_2561 [Pseudomonadota bacterium]|jgi:hypothetical protein
MKTMAGAGWLLALAAAPAGAVALDTLPLIDEPPAAGLRWQVEAGHDIARPLGRAIGSDREAAAIERLSLSVRLRDWQAGLTLRDMTLHDGEDLHRLQGWDASLRWHLPAEASGSMRWALQAGAWGHRADQLSQTTRSSLKVSGLNAQLSRFDVEHPRDRQWQLDLLGQRTLPWPGLALTVAAGLGRSEVSNTARGGAARVGGCSHELSFGATQLIAQPGEDCPQAFLISVPNRLLKFDAQRETNYRARFMHGGAALHWRHDRWLLSGGVDLQHWSRPGLDDLSSVRAPVTRIVTLATRVAHDLGPDTRLSVQLRHADHRLVGEVPMLYTARTASRFSSRQTQVELALAHRF